MLREFVGGPKDGAMIDVSSNRVVTPYFDEMSPCIWEKNPLDDIPYKQAEYILGKDGKMHYQEPVK